MRLWPTVTRLFTNEGNVLALSTGTEYWDRIGGVMTGVYSLGGDSLATQFFGQRGFDGAEYMTCTIRPVSSGKLNWMPPATCSLLANSWIRCAWHPAQC